MTFVHSVGNEPSLKSLLKYLTRNGTMDSSAGPSGPEAFPFFRCLIAALTSSAVISTSRISSKNHQSLQYLAAAEHHSLLHSILFQNGHVSLYH